MLLLGRSILYHRKDVSAGTNQFFNTSVAAQGGDYSVTNMERDKELPPGYRFTLDGVGVKLPADCTLAQLESAQKQDALEIYYDGQVVGRIPVGLCLLQTGHNTFYTQGTASDDTAIGVLGANVNEGLKIGPIEIEAGREFYVDYKAAAAISDVTVVLYGTMEHAG